ncbi:DUF6894 family protein [Pararhizobium qamdonense]|uniref:DUF6894 family protein n=1 Tax=Pararhizobium qamdonense TaxID=3031126 RepID=UPI0023E268FB|nr:hypothetical protein [Pararhizobium qamdonense]
MSIDDIGVDYPDMDTMRRESMRAAGQMLSDGEQVWAGKAWQMMVADEKGTIVYGLSFSVDRHGL